jgi:hypothetical protein
MTAFILTGMLAILATGGAAIASRDVEAGQAMTSTKFAGPKANTGTVSYSHQAGRHMLTLSQDFVTPDTPDPHWQVVDSTGTVYLLQRIAIKDGKMNRSITLPSYIRDVARVQIWCAWAEANLGEASFPTAVRLN